MTNKPARGGQQREPGADPGRAYLYAKPSQNLSPSTSLQRPPSSSSHRSAHSRSASQGSAGAVAVAAAPPADFGQRRQTDRDAADHAGGGHDRPPAAHAAEAALAALSRIHLHSSHPGASPSATTSEAPSNDISESEGGHPGAERVAAALGAIEDAKVALDVIDRAVGDAVYLDEDAYAQMVPLAQHARTIEAQQRRITELEARLDAAQRGAAQHAALTTAAQRRAGELQEELENNAVVFQLHYNELLAKDEEITKLRAVIQGLSGR